jgi:hypothetical protein
MSEIKSRHDAAADEGFSLAADHILELIEYAGIISA